MTGTTLREYDERLRVPLWWWPGTLAILLLLAAVVHSGADGVRSWLPYVVAVALTVVLLLRASRGRVRVAEGLLHVPGARVPVALVDRAVPLDPVSLRRLSGPQRHPWAFLARKGFLQTAVLVELDDPADDTPYWVVSTRRPEALAQVLSPEVAPRA
jgi:Protein of unknown function (DUF3093)